MSSVVISGDVSGTITLAAPSVAGTNIITLPAATGTVALTSQIPAAGPAFSVYLAGNQSVTSGVVTKVAFDTEEFDTNGNFASGAFTPTIAGYYQVNGTIYCNGTANTQGTVVAYLYKNGSAYKYGTIYVNNTTSASAFNLQVSALVYCNGSTDYLEIYGLLTQTSPNFSGAITGTSFNGCLVRSA